MTPEYQVLLIAAVFASQIAVLSFYTPTSWLRYHALLSKRYPREEYPLLHPLPSQNLEQKFAVFRPMHLVIGAGAIIAFLAAVVFDPSPRSLAGLMMMCLLAQMLPLYIALPLEIEIQKTSSSMPPPSPRSVELRKMRVTDFISPLWVGLGIAAQSLLLACTLAKFLYRQGTPGTIPGVIFAGAMLLVMIYAACGYGNAIATRPDPYMSQADTFRSRQRIYRGLFIGGAAFAVWNTVTLLVNTGLIHLDVAYLFVGFSIIFQVLGFNLISRQKWDLNTRDFSVYRADASAQAVR